MQSGTSGQQRFLSHLGTIIPRNKSIVGELSDLLDISMDSAYRRLRGETQLGYDEISLLCKHYQISFDSFNENGHDVVNFWYPRLGHSQEDFVAYFEGLKNDLAQSLSTNNKDKHVIYTAEGIPIFHYFNYPMLSSFKMHYWMRSILNVEELQRKKFDPEDLDPALNECGKLFYQAYQAIPSAEIWTDMTIEGVLRQLRFYWNSGVFKSVDQIIQIFDELEEMFMKIEKQVQQGYKDLVKTNNESIKGGEYSFYASDIEFENNCILLQSGDKCTVYLGHLSFQSIKTNHPIYCDDTMNWLRNLKTKSHYLSGIAETTRYKFFKSCRRRISESRELVMNDG